MFKNGLIKGSIINTAHRPKTTDGIAAKSSTIIPITSLMYLGIIFSVINIAVPTPNGIAINSEAIDVKRVPYIAVKAQYSSVTGFQAELKRNLSPYLEIDSVDS